MRATAVGLLGRLPRYVTEACLGNDSLRFPIGKDLGHLVAGQMPVHWRHLEAAALAGGVRNHELVLVRTDECHAALFAEAAFTQSAD
jgi:hypothetical protein